MSETVKTIRNVVGFNLDGPMGLKRLHGALAPYADYPEVRDEMTRISRRGPMRTSRDIGEFFVEARNR